MDVLIVALCQCKAEVDVYPCVLVEHLKPGQTANYIGTQAHGFLHQFGCSRIAENALLGKGNYFDMHHTSPALAESQ